jgi:predicted enzyme related to lactoylglutathione lyase
MMMFTAPDENAMARGGSTGALVQMAGFPSGGNSTLVYFMSEDCSVEEARVEAAGGKIFKPKFPIGPHGFISLCTDTEGNMFGVHSMK